MSEKHLSFMKMDSSSYQQIAQSSNAVSIDMDVLQVGSEPVGMRCPYCQEDVMTRATYRNTNITHIVAVALLLYNPVRHEEVEER
ncbi:hypothetical protein MSG28_000338 [Choristoneura fumiferana]|uniref:Uncharacterized protein n=1 Tax=Choristoneura fumiferana TaxID=7141 RepID=A0ACC0K0R2_CHOFU|nr:hypothetical protein MSG28_000338 [Choristoneura fumiferana]